MNDKDVIDRARSYLAEVFDLQPERYTGARGIVRELIAEIERLRGIDLLHDFVTWLWDESHYLDGYDPILNWPGFPNVDYRSVVEEFAATRDGPQQPPLAG